MTQTVLRLPGVQERTGLSRASIYQKIKRGQFPRQIKLGARAAGWIEEEVDQWIESRIQDRRRDDNSGQVL